MIYRRESFAAGGGYGDFYVVMTKKLTDTHLFGWIVFDNEKAFSTRLRILFNPRNGGRQALRRGRLGNKRERTPRQSVLPILIERQHLDGNVPRTGILLQVIENRPPEHVGKEDIQRNRRRMELAR